MYCCVLEVSRQGYYKHLARKDRPWKYQGLAQAMQAIQEEDVCNDMYGRKRMYQALLLKQPDGIRIPSESTVYRVMGKIGLVRHPKRKPNGITKADRKAMKSDDLLKRDFQAEKPLEKLSLTSRRSRPEMGNCMSRPSSTVSTPRFWAFPWPTI